MTIGLYIWYVCRNVAYIHCSKKVQGMFIQNKVITRLLNQFATLDCGTISLSVVQIDQTTDKTTAIKFSRC